MSFIIDDSDVLSEKHGPLLHSLFARQFAASLGTTAHLAAENPCRIGKVWEKKGKWQAAIPDRLVPL